MGAEIWPEVPGNQRQSSPFRPMKTKEFGRRLHFDRILSDSTTTIPLRSVWNSPSQIGSFQNPDSLGLRALQVNVFAGIFGRIPLFGDLV